METKLHIEAELKEENSKKTWHAPKLNEIGINQTSGGAIGGWNEVSTWAGDHGTIGS